MSLLQIVTSMLNRVTGVTREPRANVSGFSALEMVVVVAVIGIMAAVAVPGYSKIRQHQRISVAQMDLEILSTAIRELAWDTGSWPNGGARNEGGDDEVWDLVSDDYGLLGTSGDFDDWQGPYIREIPEDPWGNPYFFDPDYRVDSVWRIAVGSFGPNGRGRNQYDSDNVYILLD